MQLRVTIGYQRDFPPFTSATTDGPSGLVVDVLSPALLDMGVDATWCQLDLADQLPALLDGRVDVIAALAVTPARQAEVVFGEPLLRTGGALFRAIDSTSDVVRIVTPTSGPLIAAVRASFPDCEILEAVDYPDALDRVLHDEADAAALNLHVGTAIAERDHQGRFDLPDEPFAVIDLAPAFAPGHDRVLRASLDRHIVTRRGA